MAIDEQMTKALRRGLHELAQQQRHADAVRPRLIVDAVRAGISMQEVAEILDLSAKTIGRIVAAANTVTPTAASAAEPEPAVPPAAHPDPTSAQTPSQSQQPGQ